MKAKTYRQFINEAHVDASGELQEFDPSMDDNYDSYLVDDAVEFREFIEEEGATRVKISINDPYFFITFDYEQRTYFTKVDPEEENISIYTNEVEVYSDSIDSFIELAKANGLGALNV
jgi:ABC-type uncharacterized transport system substrate-binding protein